jgi:hypothetical protein
VVRVLGYRSGGPGSIPGTTRKKKSSGSGTGCTQPREHNWGATWKKSNGSCLEIREYGRRDPSRWPRGTLYPQKLPLTSPTSGGHSVGIVLSRAQTMEFFFVFTEITAEGDPSPPPSRLPLTWKRSQFTKRCILYLFRIPGDGQSPQTQRFWMLHICTNFADKRRSLGRYTSIAD